MAIRIVAVLFVSGVWNIFAQGAVLKERKRLCKTTLVNRYTFDCGREGLVQDPDIVSTSVQSTAEDCGKACLSTSGCRSLSYTKKTSKCYLYSKSLKEMYTTYQNFQPGLLYDSLCFSQDCNVIAACRATDGCASNYYSNNDQYWVYDRYACGYGVTANRVSQKNIKKETLLDGTLTACDANDACSNYDAYDLHYDKISGYWVCREVAARGDEPGPYLYTVRNDSVGAGYGYYLSDEGYID